MEYTLLEVSTLSAGAQRVLETPPSKLMAARGAAPLSEPRDLVSVLYQLCLDSDTSIRSSAEITAGDLPDAILGAAMADPATDPQVIDFFSGLGQCSAEILEVVVLNPSTADATVAAVAKVADSKLVDIISENQQRILRHTEIIGALYHNRQARMSTIDKIMELAVRHQVQVESLSTWDEICRGVLQSKHDEDEPIMNEASKDALFATAMATDDDEAAGSRRGEGRGNIRDLSTPMKLRLATLGSKFQRSELIRDPKKIVAMAVIKSPAVKENEAAKYAGNNALSEEVIGYIASRKEWTKLYHVKTALVSNPKCPLPAAMRLLPHLRSKDVANIARSRGIPSALSTQAKKLKAARRVSK